VTDQPAHAVTAPMQGTVVEVAVAVGATVRAGEPLLVLESMKLEHPLTAPAAGIVTALHAGPGEVVAAGAVLVEVRPAAVSEEPTPREEERRERTDLAEVLDRRRRTRDAARPEAVARRHDAGRRTARENVADLVDPGSFLEYGPLVVAAQRARRSLEDLVARTPADGLVAGIATVNGDEFPRHDATCAVLAYDFTVLAGTQGVQNHRKTDRLLELATRHRYPVVLFAEGGGGRPGDTEMAGRAGLDVPTFATFARLSGTVPLVAVVSGYCFAGNAILAGCCDIIIATADANLGAGGPAMIEGGGLGVVAPEEIGPATEQAAAGVVDVLVADEAEATAVARRYLSYFQGPVAHWEAPEQEPLRDVVPENRRRAYDVRPVLETIADVGSVLELRRECGRSIVTALARVEGRPVGILASDPSHLGGAIDAAAGDKAARFFQLCDAFGLPVVALVDTPGIMVGPEAERSGTVRHASRPFLAGANLSVPVMAVVLRRGYGLGAMAMVGGGFKETAFTVAWPTGEIGPMGLEGAVRLGYRRELEALADPRERERREAELVAAAYEEGKALAAATWFDLDDVIDPAETREWIAAVVRSLPPGRRWGRRPFVDAG